MSDGINVHADAVVVQSVNRTQRRSRYKNPLALPKRRFLLLEWEDRASSHPLASPFIKPHSRAFPHIYVCTYCDNGWGS
jgi:hypothetical protein